MFHAFGNPVVFMSDETDRGPSAETPYPVLEHHPTAAPPYPPAHKILSLYTTLLILHKCHCPIRLVSLVPCTSKLPARSSCSAFVAKAFKNRLTTFRRQTQLAHIAQKAMVATQLSLCCMISFGTAMLKRVVFFMQITVRAKTRTAQLWHTWLGVWS